MANWKRLVSDLFQMSDPAGSFEHYAGPGASQDSLDAIERAIGIPLPYEFRDLYMHFDGLGLVDRDESGFPPLLFKPVEQIPEYIDECRSAFSETHPNEAERYFPFIDWGNGDSSGYMLDGNGVIQPFIVTFAHEQYSYDDGQEVDEFIQPHAPSIEELLATE